MARLRRKAMVQGGCFYILHPKTRLASQRTNGKNDDCSKPPFLNVLIDEHSPQWEIQGIVNSCGGSSALATIYDILYVCNRT
eukprot:4965897-Amphidinium_carterae.1